MFITGFAAVALKTREEAPRGARVLSKPFHLRDNNAIVMVARSPALETDRRRCRLAWFGIGPGPVRHLGPKEVNG
jgi:hypothetical protein